MAKSCIEESKLVGGQDGWGLGVGFGYGYGYGGYGEIEGVIGEVGQVYKWRCEDRV